MKKRKFLKWLLLILLLAFFLAVGILIGRRLTFKEPEPMGTPKDPPIVDQRPVPSSSLPSADSNAGGVEQGGDVSSSKDLSPSGSSSMGDQSEGEQTPGDTEWQGEKERVVRGHIIDATTSVITITTEDTGETLSFMRETADVTGRLVEEAYVELYYIGEIKGTDTSAVYLTKIIVLGPAG